MSQTNIDHAAVKARCLEVIDRFKHREALREDDIRHWVREVVGVHGDAAVWHAVRASGFGGSDIGVLVRNHQGHRADHQASAHDIVMSKLLRSLPDEDSGHLRRGHENEPRHAQAFYAKYGCARDVEAFAALSAAQGPRVWMRYSPDEVVLMASAHPNPSLGGRKVVRVLADYKAPSKVEDGDEIAFQYSCQLHQGAMICAKAGIHLDGLLLSQFDWAGWRLKDDRVEYSPELARMILAAGDHYWGFVMAGQVPPYVLTPRFEQQDEFVHRFGAKAQRLAQILAVAKVFDDEAKSEAQEIKLALEDVRLAGSRLQMGDLTVTAVAVIDHGKVARALDKLGVTHSERAALRKGGGEVSYDVDGMAEKLRELGVDPVQFRNDKFDAEKVYMFLAQRGMDPESLMSEQVRMKTSQHLKEQALEVLRLTYPIPSGEDASTEEVSEDATRDVRDGQVAERPAPRTAMA